MDFVETLTTVASSPWAYAVIALVAALDAVVPVVPSEATLITAGTIAGTGQLEIAIVIAAAAAGAFAGDNVSYTLGRLGRGRLPEAPLRTAKRLLAQRGGVVLVVARFIPGGRTAATLAAGTAMPRARFLRLAAAAAAIWGAYGGLVGYAGGRAFEEEPWKGVAAGFAFAAAVALLIEGIRWLAQRRSRRRPGTQAWRRLYTPPVMAADTAITLPRVAGGDALRRLRIAARSPGAASGDRSGCRRYHGRCCRVAR